MPEYQDLSHPETPQPLAQAKKESEVNLTPHIVLRKTSWGAKLYFTGTKIPFQRAFELLAQGFTVKEIPEVFKSGKVSVEAVVDALKFACEAIEWEYAIEGKWDGSARERQGFPQLGPKPAAFSKGEHPFEPHPKVQYEVEEPPELFLTPHITVHEGMHQGFPCFRGTRIGIECALQYLMAGYRLDQVATLWGEGRVTQEGVREALQLAEKALRLRYSGQDHTGNEKNALPS